MNKENDWDHNLEADVAEGLVVCVGREDVLQALNEMKIGKEPGPSDVSMGLIAASKGVGIHVIKVLDGFGMPAKCGLSIVVAIFKGKGDIRFCSCYGAVKPLECGMKVVKRVLEKRLCRMVSVDNLQFGFMPGIGSIDAVFVLGWMRDEYHAKRKNVMCFVVIEKAFDRVHRKVL